MDTKEQPTDLRSLSKDALLDHLKSGRWNASIAHTRELDPTFRPDLSGVDLSGITGNALLCTDLKKAILIDADLSGSYAPFIELQGADLTGANFEKATIHSGNFSGAIMTGANLSGLYLDDVILKDAQMQQSADRPGANLTNTKTRSDTPVNMEGANMQGACLVGAYLPGGNFQRTDFRRTDLSTTYLVYADLTGAKLEGAIMEKTALNSSILNGATGVLIARKSHDDPMPVHIIAAGSGWHLIIRGYTKSLGDAFASMGYELKQDPASIPEIAVDLTIAIEGVGRTVTHIQKNHPDFMRDPLYGVLKESWAAATQTYASIAGQCRQSITNPDALAGLAILER